LFFPVARMEPSARLRASNDALWRNPGQPLVPPSPPHCASLHAGYGAATQRSPQGNSMLLKNKIAVVTGGSNGIGAATVRMLAPKGANVGICYNKGRAPAEALLAERPKAGHRLQQLTVEDATSVQRLAQDVRAAFGRADILVNSAGFTRPVPHADLEAL